MITYTVKPGDTLSKIAIVEYGNYRDWPILWEANRDIIPDPNLIYAGEVLYIPKHASDTVLDSFGTHNPSIHHSGHQAKHSKSVLSGHLDCHELELLWIDNGGRKAAAFIAAEIAVAESGGNQYATGPVGERGYWQINPDHGYLSTYDPNGNAKAAILISDNGRNWTPWTTYNTGAYIGQC